MVSGGPPLRLPGSSSASAFFSVDSKTCLVLLAHQIRVYNVSTRQCVRAIDINLSSLADAIVDPLALRLWLFTSSGNVIPVDWKETNPIQPSMDLDLQGFSLHSIISITTNSFYLALKSSEEFQIVHIDRDSKVASIIATIPEVLFMSISSNKHNIAFINLQHEALLFNISSAYAAFENNPDLNSNATVAKFSAINPESIPFTYRSEISSLAVSNDAVVAIGTVNGPIQVVYGGLAVQKPQRVLKWHVDLVKALLFSADDMYLISGGLEKVLVFWQLDTGKTNFLPRLSGPIERISIDPHRPDYYCLLLRTSQNSSQNLDTENIYEVMIISSLDLVSRLAVNSIRPKFANSLQSTLVKAAKRFAKSNTLPEDARLRHDYSAQTAIHPTSKLLYFPNGPLIQAYDIVRNEQAFVQAVAPTLPTGKVRSEVRLPDPVVTHIAFSAAGDWMCTIDTYTPADVDALLSKSDHQTTLKFWKFVGDAAGPRPAQWELATKIVDPHGPLANVADLVAAPASFGAAFVTADCKGGLRLWRPRVNKDSSPQVSRPGPRAELTTWSMRRARACGALSSDAVAVAWSQDGSVIFAAHECTITAIDAHTLQEIPESEFSVPSLAGSRIRAIQIVGNFLIVLSRTRLCAWDLLSGKLTDMVVAVNTTLGGRNLLAVDHRTGLFALAVNQYTQKNNALAVRSVIHVFHPESLHPVHVYHHDQAVSAVSCYNASFLFVDAESRIGTLISPSVHPSETSLAQDMNAMLLNAQATADVLSNRNSHIQVGKQSEDSADVDMSSSKKVIDLHTFLSAFNNTDGIKLETLFDRIVKIVNN